MPPDFMTLKTNYSEARFLSSDIAILQRRSAMTNVLNTDKNWHFGKNWDITNFTKAKVDKMCAFIYVLSNVSTCSEIDQKYMRPAREAALEGKKTPKQALDEVTPAAQRLLDEANR